MLNENNFHGESKIIYEDEDWLIVEPFDYDSYVYHAPDNMKSQWNYFRDGDVYLIVDKNSQSYTGFKTSMMYKKDDEISFYDWNGKELKTKERFVNNFSDEIKNIVKTIIGDGKLYSLLIKLQNGEEVSRRELENSDESIYDFKYTPKAPFKSKITFYFDDDEYVKLFDPSEDDLYYYNVITSRYDTYEFDDEVRYRDEFKEGYIEHLFIGENRAKLKEILSILSPDTVDLDTDEKRESAADKLYSHFEREIDNIISDYTLETNICKSKTFETDIREKLCNQFYNYGIFTETCFSYYFTSVGMLIALYDTFGDTTLSIKELLFNIGSEMDLSGWGEFIYEADCEDKFFDNESYNRYVSNNLDKIMEKLEDESLYADIHGYSELYKRLDLKFKKDNRYYTKYGRDFFYRGINPENNKILIQVFKPQNGGLEDRSYSEEEFNNFLVSPELFEGFIRIN